ncbi:GARP complex component Vps54 [Pseudohyphozyma bogoriensis]|nr:GARP complex component Vps54 [Pseudohyphozyma bogoriensis]
MDERRGSDTRLNHLKSSLASTSRLSLESDFTQDGAPPRLDANGTATPTNPAAGSVGAAVDGGYSISSVLTDPNAPASLLPAFPSIASNPYVPNSLSGIGTALTSGTLPRASTSSKSVAQRRSRAPPIAVSASSELRPVKKDEFDAYLQEVGPEWERWISERKLATAGAHDGADGHAGEGLGLGMAASAPGQTEEVLPPLDGVPQIFFDAAFNLSNPRTFDLVTERIRMSPSSSPSQIQDEFSPNGASGRDHDVDDASSQPIPGLGPLTLADLAADQILQEKLSHYTAVIESHLVREIGIRSSSFFAALSNLQSLHHQGEDCLAKISELQAVLSKEEKGVGGASKRGLQILRSQARRRGLETIEEGVRAVEEVWAGLEEVTDLVGHGEWMGALEVSEQVESMYYGSAATQDDDESQQTPTVDSGFTIGSPSSDSAASPRPGAKKSKSSAKLNLTRIKALDSLPRKLALLRAQVAKSLESELIGVLDRETEVAVDEFVRLSPSGGWKGKGKESADRHVSAPMRSQSPLGIVVSDADGDEEKDEGGETTAWERAQDRAQPVVRGLIRADGMEGAVAAWREAVLREVRAMVRVHLPTAETPSAEEEDAFGQISSRQSVDLGTVSEKSISLAKKLKAMTHATFLELAEKTYLGLLGTIEVVDIHSRVLLKLATDIREDEARRKARRRAVDVKAPPSHGTSLLTIPGSPDSTSPPALSTSPSYSSQPPSPVEDSSLASDVADVVHAAAELANLRFSKVIGVRTEVHSNLALEEFLEIFDASWGFVVQCEIICQRMIVGLRGVMVGQAKTFLQTFHQKRITESARLVENEQWSPSDVSAGTQKVVNLVLESAVSDPTDLLVGKRRQARLAALNGSAPENGEVKGTTKQLDIEGRDYHAVSAGLAAVDVLADYLKVVVNCPLLTTDAMSKVVEYMKSFNSRTCQVVLGAGAMRSAGLKNITAKHLALASQALSIMISLIPYIRETLRRHLNPKQAVMLVEFDKLKRDYQEHQNEIHSKLVAIMSDRLQVHSKTLESINWEAPVSGRKEGTPNAYMEALVKEHMTLHKVLSRFLQPSTVDGIMGQVFSALNLKLAEDLGKVEIKSEDAKKRMMTDVSYLKTKLAELKGLERETPGVELEHLVESKQTPQAVAPPALRRISSTTERTSSLPGASQPPPVPTVVEASPAPSQPQSPALPISSLPSSPDPANSPVAVPTPDTVPSPFGSPLPQVPLPAPTPTPPPVEKPPPPVKRKSMAERLAEIARRGKPVEQPPPPPPVPSVPVPQEKEMEKDVEEATLIAPGANGHSIAPKMEEQQAVAPTTTEVTTIEGTGASASAVKEVEVAKVETGTPEVMEPTPEAPVEQEKMDSETVPVATMEEADPAPSEPVVEATALTEKPVAAEQEVDPEEAPLVELSAPLDAPATAELLEVTQVSTETGESAALVDHQEEKIKEIASVAAEVSETAEEVDPVPEAKEIAAEPVEEAGEIAGFTEDAALKVDEEAPLTMSPKIREELLEKDAVAPAEADVAPETGIKEQAVGDDVEPEIEEEESSFL